MLRTLMLTVALLAAPTAHAAQTYVCRISENGNSGWIPEVLFIGREDDADTVIVSDPLILYYNDRAPVRGRVAAENPQRITFVWSIPATPGAGRSVTRLQFTATYLKSARRMLIAATPLGYSSHYSGDGTCSVERR